MDRFALFEQRVTDFQAARQQVAAPACVMRLVYAVAAEARSIAFLKRAVAISSIVRVILRMLRIDLRRLSSTRGLAMAVRCRCQESEVRIAMRNDLHGYGFAVRDRPSWLSCRRERIALGIP